MVDPANREVIHNNQDRRVTIMLKVDTGQVAAVKFIVGVIAEMDPILQIYFLTSSDCLLMMEVICGGGRTNQATTPQYSLKKTIGMA